MINNIVEKAEQFARTAHESIGHRRKYTGESYVTHLEEVVEILKKVEHTDEMLAAAWLHDTVEDTQVTIEDIYENFGDEIAEMVDSLTDISKPLDGNRKTRKAIDRAHLAKASPDVQTIKLADLISNSASIVAHDPKFAKVYLEEKRLLLEVLTAGNKELREIAHNQCRYCYATI